MEAAGARRHGWLDAQHDSAPRYHRGRTDVFIAEPTKSQNRKSAEAALHSRANADARHYGNQ